MPYIYESHLSGLFSSESCYIDTYCESCGDSDMLIGYAGNIKEGWALLKPYTDYRDRGGYMVGYIKEFLKELFPDEQLEINEEGEAD